MEFVKLESNRSGYTYGHIDRDEIWTEEYEPETDE